MDPRLKKLVNLVLFNVGWFCCVLLASTGYSLLGVVAVAVIVAIQLSLNGFHRAELKLMVLTVVIGFIVDTMNGWAGVLAYPSPALLPWLTPLWLIALWFNFSMAINGCLSWMQNRLLLALVFAAIGGPLTYYAGSRFGAVDMSGNLVFSLVALAIEWALIFPGLLLINRELGGPAVK